MQNKYDKDNLKNTIRDLSNLVNKANMELKEMTNYCKDVEAMFDQREKTLSKSGILVGAHHLIGRTIENVSCGKADWGGYSTYLFFLCEDGQRVLTIGSTSESMQMPRFEIEYMERSKFFTKEEIQKVVDFKNAEQKRSEEDEKKRKLKELEKLKKELEG